MRGRRNTLGQKRQANGFTFIKDNPPTVFRTFKKYQEFPARYQTELVFEAFGDKFKLSIFEGFMDDERDGPVDFIISSAKAQKLIKLIKAKKEGRIKLNKKTYIAVEMEDELSFGWGTVRDDINYEDYIGGEIPLRKCEEFLVANLDKARA